MQPEAILERFHNHIEEVIDRAIEEHWSTIESSVFELFDKYTRELPSDIRNVLEVELKQTLNEFKEKLAIEIKERIMILIQYLKDFAVSALGKRLFKSGDICAVFIHGYEIAGYLRPYFQQLLESLGLQRELASDFADYIASTIGIGVAFGISKLTAFLAKRAEGLADTVSKVADAFSKLADWIEEALLVAQIAYKAYMAYHCVEIRVALQQYVPAVEQRSVEEAYAYTESLLTYIDQIDATIAELRDNYWQLEESAQEYKAEVAELNQLIAELNATLASLHQLNQTLTLYLTCLGGLTITLYTYTEEGETTTVAESSEGGGIPPGREWWIVQY